MDQEQEHFVLSELKQWGFFGLQHQNVLLIPLPRFPGFAKVSDHALCHLCGLDGQSIDYLCILSP